VVTGGVRASRERLIMSGFAPPQTQGAGSPPAPALDRLIPAPAMVEVDHVVLAAESERVWQTVRHLDLAASPIVRALFTIRTLPNRLTGRPAEVRVRLDDLVSSPTQPGFQILVDDPPHEIAVGAIGKVWHLQIPFVHVADADAFASFMEPDFVKVAWAIRVSPEGERNTRVDFEVRVDATDPSAWRKFRRYFRIIGPGSHFIRRVVLSDIVRALGTPETMENQQPFPSDALLPDAAAQVADAITIAATPEQIWPWLVQMGCRRGGFYSVDLLDNAGVPSAREIHPELQQLAVGDIIPATPKGPDGFEVLQIDEPRALVLGGLYDAGSKKQLPFAEARPERFWHVTWAFVLEQIDGATTRLHVRARAAFPPSGRRHALWMRHVHHFMQSAQLRHLAARAEGRLPRDTPRDIVEGVAGAALMTLAWLTPFLRKSRQHWGVDLQTATRRYPGDDLVPEPRWSWTHGVEIEAPAETAWPWIAQLGANRGGFYSYQWLENVAGCKLRNAETPHPEWELHEGDALVLHPRAPSLRVVAVDRGRSLLTYDAPATAAHDPEKPWAAVSWLFLIEPLGEHRCRVISRFRSACSDDLATWLATGPAVVEPVGFVMDRRMLLGIKERSERLAARGPDLTTR
jgi:hypothetical protein